jgi:hypothetical protein
MVNGAGIFYPELARHVAVMNRPAGFVNSKERSMLIRLKNPLFSTEKHRRSQKTV